VVIHLLHEGFPLCGFSELLPRDWPDGHRWVGLDALGPGVREEGYAPTCEACKRVAADRNFKPGR
jgi:hypothetical protein